MRVLAFDQATKISGLSIFEDGRLVQSGLLDQQKIKDTKERFNAMAVALCDQVDIWKPDLVILEDTDLQTNAAVMKLLAQMQGVVMGYCTAHHIPYQIFKPSEWRKRLEFKQGPKVKRDELKVQALEWVLKTYGWEPEIDQAEAICIGAAFWS